MSKVLNASTDLLKLRKTVRVELPETDCTVILREMGYGQLMSLDTDEDRRDVVKQLAMMIVNEDGDLIFTTPEDLKRLAELGRKAIVTLAEAAGTLNGSSKEASEELTKNLPPEASASA